MDRAITRLNHHPRVAAAKAWLAEKFYITDHRVFSAANVNALQSGLRIEQVKPSAVEQTAFHNEGDKTVGATPSKKLAPLPKPEVSKGKKPLLALAYALPSTALGIGASLLPYISLDFGLLFHVFGFTLSPPLLWTALCVGNAVVGGLIGLIPGLLIQRAISRSEQTKSLSPTIPDDAPKSLSSHPYRSPAEENHASSSISFGTEPKAEATQESKLLDSVLSQINSKGDYITSRLGNRYKLTTAIATGGQGVVWAAVNDKGENFAIKALISTPSEDEEAASGNQANRLRREIDLLKKIHPPHRNIIKIIDDGEVNGYPFIVMELLQGKSLQATLSEHRKKVAPFSVEEGLQIIIDIVLGLARVDQEGIFHRDIKPGNIHLEERGAVVLDFAGAKAGDSSTLTQGNMIATFPYKDRKGLKAPAEMTEETKERIGDIYSVGVIAYELFTLVRPFPIANNLIAWVELCNNPSRFPLKQTKELMKRNGEIALAITLPQSVFKIIEKMLTDNYENAYQNYNELLQDLKACLSGYPRASSLAELEELTGMDEALLTNTLGAKELESLLVSQQSITEAKDDAPLSVFIESLVDDAGPLTTIVNSRSFVKELEKQITKGQAALRQIITNWQRKVNRLEQVAQLLRDKARKKGIDIPTIDIAENLPDLDRDELKTIVFTPSRMIDQLIRDGRLSIDQVDDLNDLLEADANLKDQISQVNQAFELKLGVKRAEITALKIKLGIE